MPKYYLIKNNLLLDVIDSDNGHVAALPLLQLGDSMSLLNETHASNLMANLNLTAAQALAALGISDSRASLIQTVFVAPQIVSLKTNIEGAAYKLVDIGAFSLYQVNSNQANLLALHNELWSMSPAQTLGLLAVVQVFGTSFYASAARTATGMTLAQAAARHDLIVSYLQSIGKTNTAALSAATDEQAQINGIVTALGYTMAQLWAAMTP